MPLLVFSGIRLAFAIVLMLAVLPLRLVAQFEYTTNNGQSIITQYTGGGGAVVIPATNNDLPVTEIGPNAFVLDGSGVTSITIPNSIVSIDTAAFEDCYSLQQVSIPNSVINLGSFAFYVCTSLASVTIGTNVSIIGAEAFQGCISLKSLTISDGVGGIGDNAFENCFSLAGVSIPASVTYMGQSPFNGCTELTAITVDAQNPAYSSAGGVLFNSSQTTLVEYPGGIKGNYAVPSGVTAIGAFGFAGATNVSVVFATNGLNSIGSNAFINCSGLVNVILTDMITNLGVGAFVDCVNLTNVTLGNTAITSIQDQLFENCSLLRGVTIPGTVTNIGNDAFLDCNDLINIVIPNSVTSIGGGAFSFTGLTNLVIPDSVTSIGSDAFYFDYGLTNITIGDGVTTLGSHAFWLCPRVNGFYFAGNAPIIDSTVFTGDSGTVYYLPETTGWQAFNTNSGLAPAVLWNPQAETGGASFGVKSNQFGFNIIGTTNIPFIIQANTNLANPDWVSLEACTLTNGSIYFSDRQWTNYPSRFYRLAAP